MNIFTHLRFLLFLTCCFVWEFAPAQTTYFHPTTGIQNTYAGACAVNLCNGVYVDDGGTGGNYMDNVNNVYRTFCPNTPGQCIRLTFTQFSLEAPDLDGDCWDALTISSGPTQNSPVVWQGCGSTLPPVITSTDPSGCITVRFTSDGIISAAGWRANITCAPCGGQGPSPSLSTDCGNAQYVCDNQQPIIANSQGPGLSSESCVSGCAISENYSNWFILNITNPGSLTFTITPTPNVADYDFALYGPVSGGCSSLGAPIRCSYAANIGTTGMRTISSDPSEDVSGDGWVSSANTVVGTYYLLVNQWAYEPSSTFRLDFGGTTVIGLPPLTDPASNPNAPVTVTSNSPVCSNQALQFTASLVPGATYSWSGPGGWTSNQQNPTRNPPVAGNYSVFYTVNGCNSSTTSVAVSVNTAPTATVNPTAVSICPGQSTTLTASGGGTYAWSNTGNAATNTVSPASTTTYTVTVTSNGCSATASSTVTVTANLPAAINPSPAVICTGQSVTLTASGGATYVWSNNGETSSTITVNPTTTTTYSVTATSGACTGTASATVTVNNAPNGSIFPPDPHPTICQGMGTLITASGGGTYRWSTNQTTASISVAPPVTTTYTVTVTLANGCADTVSKTVTVITSVNAGITPATATICSGESIQLTGSGGGTYRWSNNNETSQSITVSPITTTTYTVTVTAPGGCSATASRTVTVNQKPVAAINPSSTTICTGTSTTLTATGGGTYLWSNASQAPSTSVAPLATTTYIVTVTAVNGCTDTASSVVTVSNGPNATISPLTATICPGGNTTLTADGGVTYRWNTNDLTQSINVAPAITTTYTVTVTDASNCTATATRTVTVHSNPTVTILPLNASVCEGASATLTASGGTTYLWDNNAGSTDVVTVSPATTTTYSVTVTDANNCTATGSRTVTVNATPDIVITPAPVSICEGTSATLTASGASSFLWSTNEVVPVITVSPITTTDFTVTGTDANSCTATETVTVTVLALPAAAVTPATVAVCEGESTTLTATGGTTYLWDNSAGNTAIVSVTPLTTTTYTVTVTDANSCSATATGTVTVNQNPAAQVSPAAVTICEGTSTTLTASGGTSYLWDHNAAITDEITVSPITTTTYSVTVTDANNCSATSSGTVTVDPNLVITINPSTISICEGESATLTANGGTAYTWSTADQTQSITVSPLTTTTYTVSATDGSSCSGTASATVTVNTLPNAVVTPATVAICEGASATLTASGGTTYLWDNSAGSTDVITVSPVTTTTYNVTVSDGNCSATASGIVTVNPNPVATIDPATVAICEGESTTLTASGGTAYLWDNNAEITDEITVNPITTTTYSVTVTDGNNCSATTSRSVTVNALPNVIITPASVGICEGESATLTASGANSYVWDNNAGNTDEVTVTPLTTTTYTVTGTDANNCSATATSTVTVNTIPNAVVTPATISICEGASTTLTASGGTTYLWNNNAGSTDVITVSPITTTTYNVTVSDGNCSATASGIVTVNQNPVATIDPATVAICEGVSTTLTASGGTAYVWDNNAGITNEITVNPITTTTYSVTVTDANNCTASTSRAVTVNALPNVIVTPATVSICNGASTTLTASGASSYLWDHNAAITDEITVNPVTTTTYTVTGTDVNNCVATATATVTVNPLPIAGISPFTASICTGGSTTLTATGGTTYQWDNNEVTDVITVAPLTSTTYTVTVTDDNLCSAVASRTVFVSQSLVVDILPATVSICEGESATLTASGGTTYIWSTTEVTSEITVTPLVTTTYSVTADDGTGCTGTASRDVTVFPNPTAIITPTYIDICEGASTTLTATGGGTYLWSTTEITDIITVAPTFVGANSYQVTVTDANGCTADTVALVTVVAGPIPTITSTGSNLCTGSSATLTVDAAASYLWSTTELSQSITVAPAITSTFDVTVTDANGCTGTASELVTINPAPSVQVSATPASICEGGSSTLTATGGTGYVWSTTEQTNIITVAPVINSTYDVTVTDANNCTATASTAVTVNPNPTVTIDASASVVCGGQDVTLTGVGASTYAWSTNETGGSISVTPFVATSYSVTGTDANNCTGEGSTTIDVTQSMTLTSVANDASCADSSDGSVDITITGGQTPFTYAWSNGFITEDITDVPADTYSITVTDNIGCASTTSAVVDEPAPVVVTGVVKDASCNDGTDGAIDLTVNGGTSPYAYLWSDGDLNEDRVNLSSGNYSVIVTDANTCSTNSDYIITEGAIININAVPENPSCAMNGNDGNIAVSVSGGASPYSYMWSNNNTSDINSSLAPGTYGLTVSDDNGCSESASYTLTYEYVFATDAGNGVTITIGESVTLGYTLAGNAGNIISSSWEPAQSLSCGACPEPNATPQVSTLYTVTVTNEEGCEVTDTVRVNVIEEGQIVAPNAFTPDGDGVNDYFQVYGNISTVDFFEVMIFNRWGEKMFESNDPTFKWDGVYRGELLRPDVYIFQVRLSTLSSTQIKVKKGSVTIMR